MVGIWTVAETADEDTLHLDGANLNNDELDDSTSSGSSSTPSPRTHNLILVGSECKIAKTTTLQPLAGCKLAPIVDPEESDADEVYGVV